MLGVVRRRPLVAVVETRTVRHRQLLYDRRGTALGSLDDDVIEVQGGERDGRRLRELVVDLDVALPQGQLVLDFLRDLGASTTGDLHADLVLAGRSADRVTPVGRSSSIGAVIVHSIASGLDRLIDHDTALRLESMDPEPHDIHQARVATRRLRSDLKTFSEFLDPVWLAHVRGDLRWLGAALGQLRDLDVLSDSLHAGARTVPAEGWMAIQSTMVDQRRRAAVDLRAAMASDRYLDLLDRLHAAAEDLPLLDRTPAGRDRRALAARPAARVLPGLVAAQWRSLRRKYRAAGASPSDHELHQLRIRAKQLRYAAEAASPVLGKAQRVATRAEKVQTVLGEFHDAVVAEEWLTRESAFLTPAGSYAAGRLAEQQVRRQRRRRSSWRGSWDELEGLDIRRRVGAERSGRPHGD